MLRAARSCSGALLTVCALAVVCCDESSPNGPNSPDPNGNVILFADPSGALRPLERRIRSLIEEALARSRGELAVTGVTLTISPDASRTIPGWGMGGFTSNAATVEMFIDPGFPGIAALIETRLSPLTAHELHHAVRVRGPGIGRTLLDALVSEGLADQFALELYGGPPTPWMIALQGAELEEWLDRASKEFDSTTYDRPSWFRGNGTIPRFAGYAIGHELVVRYQAAHPGQSAADLVGVAAEAFRPD